jgi:hypothetical protein
MGYYLQEGCEHITEGPELPSAESFVDLTKAFIAALGVRDGAKNLFELDHYYLGNLGDPAEADEKAINAESVIKLSRRWVDRINQARANGTRRPTPGFIGRNLYVVFRDEERLRGVQPLNEVLRPLHADAVSDRRTRTLPAGGTTSA